MREKGNGRSITVRTRMRAFRRDWERLYYLFRNRVSFFNLAVWLEIEGHGRRSQGAFAIGQAVEFQDPFLTIHLGRKVVSLQRR